MTGRAIYDINMFTRQELPGMSPVIGISIEDQLVVAIKLIY